MSCVHATTDPIRDIDQQSDRVLLRGHCDFLKQDRDDGHWVVRGYTVVHRPLQAGGRISIDTGAYASGHLTAAFVSPDTCRFVTT